MKIVILQGSPNKKGSTNILVENFSQGAEAAGHSIRRFDLADMDICPCTGCVSCGYEGPCILHDENQKIKKAVLDADMRGRKIFCVYGKNSSLIRNRYV